MSVPANATLGKSQDSGRTANFGEEFLAEWKQLAKRVEQELSHCLSRMTDDCPPRLREAIGYSLMAPGKRLRPLLCLWACNAVSGQFDAAIPNAVALEMIHCYSLIHDDLPAMDDDDLRRGLPTCHIQFDEATAILAGDALQPLAFEAIVRGNTSPEIAAQSCLVLAKAAGGEGMVGGQMDDLLAENRDPSLPGGSRDAKMLHAIHSRKTGALIRAAVCMGGLAGRASQDQLDRLVQYGDAIGIAFQIVDDLLDVESTSENTGKRTGKDEKRGKLTFPSIYGVEESRNKAKELIDLAVSLVEPFGTRGQPLKHLARYIMDRSN